MKRIALAVSALIVALSLGSLPWLWLGHGVNLVDVPGGRLQCLSYTPYDGSSSPLDGKDFRADASVIRADLEAIARVSGCVRTYSAITPADQVVPIAAELGLKVWQGLWIGTKDKENEAEIQGALALAKAYPGVIDRFVVGNEVLLRRELLGEELAAIIRRVKDAQPDIPVTYADVPEFWRRNPVLADAADIVTIHILPYWDDPLPMTMDEVQAHSRALVEEMRDRYPGHQIAIGEIGWPSAGRTRGGIIPTVVNEAKFVREFVAQADAIGVDYNIVEAIDQDWKIVPEGTVGGHWGILDHKRAEKFPLTGPVSEWPRWPLAFALSSLGALAAVLAALVKWRPASAPRWLAMAALGQLTGTVSVMGWRYVSDLAFGLEVWALNLVMLALALYALVSLLPHIADGRPFKPALSVHAVAAWLRRPHRATFDQALVQGLLLAVPLLWAGQMAILHAFDGRHRDFPLVILLPVALAQILRWRDEKKRSPRGDDCREEGWIAFALLMGAALAWNGPDNVEAMAWMGTLVLLALPWLGALKAEALRLAGRG